MAWRWFRRLTFTSLALFPPASYVSDNSWSPKPWHQWMKWSLNWHLDPDHPTGRTISKTGWAAAQEAVRIAAARPPDHLSMEATSWPAIILHLSLPTPKRPVGGY